MKYKVGDKFKSPDGFVFEIVATHPLFRMYWALEDGTGPWTHTEMELDNCKKIETFFQVGEAYVGKFSRREYVVRFVDEVGDKKFAVTVFDDELVLLNEYDYASDDYQKLR